MFRKLVPCITILFVTPVLALGQEPPDSQSDQPATESCVLACAKDPDLAPPECACGGAIESGSATSSGTNERTARAIIEQMVETYHAEIMLVDNYLVIEKSTIAPIADTRFFERKGSYGELVLVPSHELGRRQTAANPPSDEMPPEVAEDPTLMLGGLAEAFDIIGGELGGAGGLFKAASDAARQAQADGAAAFEEAKDGISGADDSDGLLGDASLDLFWKHGELDPEHFGVFAPDGTDERFLKIKRDADPEFNYFKGIYDQLFGVRRISGEELKHLYRRLTELPEGGYLCEIVSLGGRENSLGNRLESGEMWACWIPDYEAGYFISLRPVRIRLEYTMKVGTDTGPGLQRKVVERVTDRYRKVGPITLPHRIRERVGGGAEDIGRINWQDARSGVDKFRKYFVNEGTPSQADLAAIIAEAMEDPDLYPE